MIKAKFIFLTLGLYFILSSASANAQSYHYMDDAGNIYFVDRADQIPNKYRNQMPGFNPTPKPIKDKKAQKKLEKELAKKEREKEKERKKREKLANKKPKVKKLKVTQAQADEIHRLNAEKAKRANQFKEEGQEAEGAAPEEADPSIDATSGEAVEEMEVIK